MKKILAILLCAMIMCAMPLVAFAEGDTTEITVQETSEVETTLVTEETIPEETIPAETIPEETTPIETTPTETLPEETLPVETTPTEEAPEEVAKSTSEQILEHVQNYLNELTENENVPEVALTTSEKIVEYIRAHLEEISVIVTLVLSIFYQIRKHKALNKSVATLNNNAVTVAENSNNAMQQALMEVGDISNVVGGYKDEVAALLAEVRRNTEEKQQLERTLAEVHTHLKQSKLANVEFANELAELLVLANIPNSKKDELYARHIAAVGAISATEEEENVTLPEVIADDNGKEEE